MCKQCNIDTVSILYRRHRKRQRAETAVYCTGIYSNVITRNRNDLDRFMHEIVGVHVNVVEDAVTAAPRVAASEAIGPTYRRQTQFALFYDALGWFAISVVTVTCEPCSRYNTGMQLS